MITGFVIKLDLGKDIMTATAATNASLAELAYQNLLDRIILLDIGPGEPIVESRLAEEIQVGRTPLREALKRLETDHLVVSYPRRGTFTTQVDMTELSNISDVRRALEPLAARRAAEHGGGPVRPRLLEILEQLRSLTPDMSQRDLLTFDLSVHRTMYQAAQNPYLTETLVRLDNIATRIWAALSDRLPSMFEHITEHTNLIEAIVESRPEDAEAAATAHVVGFEKTVREVF